MASNSESRKRREGQPLLREADRLSVHGRVLAALRRVYPTADFLEADALRDALEDEELLR